MSDGTENKDGDKYAIVVRTPDLLAQRDELKLADEAERKERAWNEKCNKGAEKALILMHPAGYAGMFAGILIPGLHSLGASMLLGVGGAMGFWARACYLSYKGENKTASKRAYDLRLEFRKQSRELTARLKAQAEAVLNERLNGVDYPPHGEIIPFRCEDGSDKIVKITAVERGTKYDETDKAITVITVTAQLYDAVKEESTGALRPGRPVEAISPLIYVRKDELHR